MGELQLPIQVTLRNEAGRPKDQPLHPCKGRLLGRLQAVLEAQVAFGGEACLARALSPSWGPVPESHSRRQVGTEIWVLTAAGTKGSSTDGGERAPSAGQGVVTVPGPGSLPTPSPTAHRGDRKGPCICEAVRGPWPMGSFGERGWACPEVTGGGVAARVLLDPGDPSH